MQNPADTASQARVPLDLISRTPRLVRILILGAFAGMILDLRQDPGGLGAAITLFFLMLSTIGVAQAMRACRGWLIELGTHLDRIVIDDPEGDANSAWRQQLDLFGADGKIVIYGLALAVFAPAVYYFNGIADGLAEWRIWAVLTLIAIAAGAAGLGLGYIVTWAQAFIRWSHPREFVLSDSPFGVATIGSRLFWCFVTIIAVQILYLLSGALQLQPGKPFDLDNPAMLFIGYPVSVFLAGAFFWVQFPIHRKLLAVKRARMAAIDASLEQLLGNLPAIPDDATRTEISYLHNLRDRLIHVPTWPFRPRLGYAAVIIGLVSPTLSLLGEGPLVNSVKALLSG